MEGAVVSTWVMGFGGGIWAKKDGGSGFLWKGPDRLRSRIAWMWRWLNEAT